MLMKMSLFDFLASSIASDPHICHATGLFMWPRTYGLRLSFSLFFSVGVSLDKADAPDVLRASIVRIEVWNLCSSVRAVRRAVVTAWEGARREGGVAIAARAEEQGPRRLNRTRGIQQWLSRAGASAVYHRELRGDYRGS